MKNSNLQIMLIQVFHPMADEIKVQSDFRNNVIEVRPGNSFLIPNKFEGIFFKQDDSKFLYMNLNGSKEITYSKELHSFKSGSYLFHFDGKTIEMFSAIQED